MALIDKSNLYTEAWNNIYNIVNNRTYINDPSNSSGSRKFVYARQPQIKSVNFNQFPYIIVNQPTLIQSRDSINQQRKRIKYTINLEIHTSDQTSDGTPNQPGNGQKWLNSISDDMQRTFNLDTVKQSLRALGVQNIKLDSTDSDLDMINDHLVFTRTFTLTFEDKKVVF